MSATVGGVLGGDGPDRVRCLAHHAGPRRPRAGVAVRAAGAAETTIAAMRTARAGNLKSFDSVEALMTDLHAQD